MEAPSGWLGRWKTFAGRVGSCSSEWMNSTEPRVVCVESVDDIAVLLAILQRLKVDELLDRHFPTHHLWEGELTFGEVVIVWLAFVLSQGDHRLAYLLPWVQQHLLTLQTVLGKTVRPLDFHDDRLADILDALAQAEHWLPFEVDLNRHTLRVYDLTSSVFRIDTTTASSYAQVISEQGIIQFGHSKDDSSRPQLKVAAAVLDPLGLPITTVVVAGNISDDGLYVPEIKKIQETFGAGGKTHIGDCKMAAFTTRLYVASTRDFYLCPLSESQLAKEERQALLQPVWDGTQQLQPVFRPPATPDGQPELIAEGFPVDVVLCGQLDGKEVTWTERRWFVRSVAFAQAQEARLEARIAKAIREVERLNERKQGKKRLSLEETKQAAERIIKEAGVEAFVSWRVQVQTHERKVRGYRGRPDRVEREEEYRVATRRREEAIREAKQAMGWQVYASNDLGLSMAAVVWSYRGQYQIEQDWSRLKGRPLSLVPMYLTEEERMRGLVLLLSLALRVLSLLEWQVRKKLQARGEKLKGIYPGQPGRQTARPSAELLLRAMRGISLTVIDVGGRATRHLTPLNPVQQRLLDLWDLPPDLYQRLTRHSSQPPLVLSEP
jgi:transposase